MTPIASLVLPALFLVIAPARAAEVVVHVTRSGEALEVEASAEFQGNIRRTWQVLTDYDRRLATECQKALEGTEMKDRYVALGLEPMGTIGDEFADFLKKQNDRYAAIAKQANIKLD